MALLGTGFADQFLPYEGLMGDDALLDSVASNNRDYRSLYKLFKKLDFLQNYNPYAYYGNKICSVFEKV